MSLVGPANEVNSVRRGDIQLELPSEEPGRVSLEAAVGDVRDRFGSLSITRGVLVGKDPGLTMPMLPD